MKKFLSIFATVLILMLPLRAEAKSDLCGQVVVSTWPVALQKKAARVCRCESSNNPSARNPDSTATGLFQILRGTWFDYGSGNIYNPYDNSSTGYRIFKGQGWGAWTPSRKCWS